jgi:hypothetical protein
MKKWPTLRYKDYPENEQLAKKKSEERRFDFRKNDIQLAFLVDSHRIKQQPPEERCD